MSKTIITIIAASLTLAALPLVAAASETDAACEQPYWIGYLTSRTIREAYYGSLGPSDPRMNNCEGEHWDGQDTVAPGHAGNDGSPCLSTSGTSVSYCMKANPNQGGADINSGNVLLFRVSVKGTETYVAVDIAGVGRAATYNGACAAGGSLEGGACGGTAGTRHGVYARDNTDQVAGGQNVLAGAVSALGITRGYASEADCDQATYQKGAEENNRTLCGRDNTAITVETILP